MIEIALFQPDIAPNAATLLRMAACFGLKVTIIEPAGFAWTDSSYRRAGMDYLDRARVTRAASWRAFRQETENKRLVLLSTKAETAYTKFQFSSEDVLIVGQESSGAPAMVHDAVAARLLIPMQVGERSLNVSLACAMVTGEAMRQLGKF
jgi:tRNA (cytidine/uridine-2'-O-)-methyltransferase